MAAGQTGAWTSYRFEVYHRAVGHDCVVSLHVHLTFVIACICQTVDRAALGTGTDWHAGCGLVAPHAVHCTRPTHNVFWLLKITHMADSNKVTTLRSNNMGWCNTINYNLANLEMTKMNGERVRNKLVAVETVTWQTSSSSCASVVGPLWASWNKIFFILRYCRLSSSRTASLVRLIRSIRTDSGRSRWTNACWRKHTENTSSIQIHNSNVVIGIKHNISLS